MNLNESAYVDSLIAEIDRLREEILAKDEYIAWLEDHVEEGNEDETH